jgi:hypothetical protein
VAADLLPRIPNEERPRPPIGCTAGTKDELTDTMTWLAGNALGTSTAVMDYMDHCGEGAGCGSEPTAM